MAAEGYRYHFDDYVRKAEVSIYAVLAVLLTFTALAALGDGAMRPLERCARPDHFRQDA